jgi:hypothetical protein
MTKQELMTWVKEHKKEIAICGVTVGFIVAAVVLKRHTPANVNTSTISTLIPERLTVNKFVFPKLNEACVDSVDVYKGAVEFISDYGVKLKELGEFGDAIAEELGTYVKPDDMVYMLVNIARTE